LGQETGGWAVSSGCLDGVKWKIILHAIVEKIDWFVDEVREEVKKTQ